MRKIALIVLSCLLLASCGNKYKGFKKTGNGLYYRFWVENSTCRMPENDDIIFLEMSIRTEKDSVVLPSKQIQTMMQISPFKGDFYEALSLMHEGDSAEFIINAKKYFEVDRYGQIPEFVKNDEMMLWFTIRIDSIRSWEQYKMTAKTSRLDAEKKSIENYLTANNLTAAPQASGLYYIEIKEGKGKNPVNGQNVKVHYTGKLLDGTVFDSSIGKDPMGFVFGGGMIPGFTEGISLMKKGGKAILLIPSYLGYGENAAGGGKIPPYSPLLFEVELLSIE
jgi:FKBP-type peptidyl-prolyl cis-trans isomerase